MVTNLPAEAKAKWIKVMEARTVEEKIKALEEFLSSVPKHKGTENLRRWVTRRLAELREELEEKKRKRSGRGERFFVEKEGDAQIVVIGLPNSGKSTLVKQLTGAKTIISETPFSTRYPTPGMFKYKDVYFQLIDTPPLYPGSVLNTKIAGLVRNSDAVLIVLDGSSDIVKDYEFVRNEMEEQGILLEKPRGKVVIERERGGRTGIRVTLLGKLIDATIDDIRKLLESYRIYNAHVKIYGEVTLDNVEESIYENIVYLPSIVFINKMDINTEEVLNKLHELKRKYREITVLTGSALQNRGFENLGEILFETLDLIRIYTKQVNGEVSPKPLVLKKGSTVYDVAKAIHKDFIEKFQYAKVWGRSVKYGGERVGLFHVLEDGDIVEIHIRG
uniref:TGS domain-containing protein n=1 Tax=Staphylothermus marinus TaxID=2280 RepID=A0A7C4NN87_STAMA